jgi:hypothetical protein
MLSSIQSNNFKTSVSVCLIMKLIYLFFHSRRKSIVFYSPIMAITRSDKLRHSPTARDTKSSSRVIAIIIRLFNNITIYYCYCFIIRLFVFARFTFTFSHILLLLSINWVSPLGINTINT